MQDSMTMRSIQYERREVKPVAVQRMCVCVCGPNMRAKSYEWGGDTVRIVKVDRGGYHAERAVKTDHHRTERAVMPFRACS